MNGITKQERERLVQIMRRAQAIETELENAPEYLTDALSEKYKEVIGALEALNEAIDDYNSELSHAASALSDAADEYTGLIDEFDKLASGSGDGDALVGVSCDADDCKIDPVDIGIPSFDFIVDGELELSAAVSDMLSASDSDDSARDPICQ